MPPPQSNAAGYWSSVGPYFAMMPAAWADDIIDMLCPPGGSVLDPFMGRGTTLFSARNSGRYGLGCDVSPLAWLWTATKCDPEPDPLKLISRLADVEADIRQEDSQPENEFQAWCWSPRVLAFLRSARRGLDWQGCRTDRTLMSIILIYIHGKAGYALSNQMSGSRPTSPDYSVAWWSERDMTAPDVDPVDFMIQKIQFRYKFGIPIGPQCDIRLGQAQHVLPAASESSRFDLLFTSPPYLGVTNYRLDNWIRLWMLGDLALPDLSDTSQKYANRQIYIAMLDEVFHRSAALLRDDAAVLVRTDSRAWTRNVTASLISEIWPDRQLFWRSSRPEKSQTELLNPDSSSPGETDFLIHSAGALPGFTPVDKAVLRDGVNTILSV